MHYACLMDMTYMQLSVFNNFLPPYKWVLACSYVGIKILSNLNGYAKYFALFIQININYIHVMFCSLLNNSGDFCHLLMIVYDYEWDMSNPVFRMAGCGLNRCRFILSSHWRLAPFCNSSCTMQQRRNQQCSTWQCEITELYNSVTCARSKWHKYDRIRTHVNSLVLCHIYSNK